ncbi:hypothetical protein [Sphingobium sp. Sx8-8]|uniref:hypothetical protein n=1 Tax=Sphingobium sp. Sx8-8 TaxID=2933617 RepID=UPI001F59F51E|nr:hypothetical protein [Sphingobium sp. Sx8-8]
MSLTLLFGGTVAPFLLIFSPITLAAARDGLSWDAPAKMPAKRPCPKKRPPLMLM